MSRLTHQAARRRKNEFDFELANRLFFRLYRASNLMYKTGSRSVAEFSSTTQQWAVLGALSRPAVRQHGMTVKELIEFLLTSRQNLTAVSIGSSDWGLLSGSGPPLTGVFAGSA